MKDKRDGKRKSAAKYDSVGVLSGVECAAHVLILCRQSASKDRQPRGDGSSSKPRSRREGDGKSSKKRDRKTSKEGTDGKSKKKRSRRGDSEDEGDDDVDEDEDAVDEDEDVEELSDGGGDKDDGEEYGSSGDDFKKPVKKRPRKKPSEPKVCFVMITCLCVVRV